MPAQEVLQSDSRVYVSDDRAVIIMTNESGDTVKILYCEVKQSTSSEMTLASAGISAERTAAYFKTGELPL